MLFIVMRHAFSPTGRIKKEPLSGKGLLVGCSILKSRFTRLGGWGQMVPKILATRNNLRDHPPPGQKASTWGQIASTLWPVVSSGGNLTPATQPVQESLELGFNLRISLGVLGSGTGANRLDDPFLD